MPTRHLNQLVTAGALAVARHRRLVLGLYLAQATLALVFTLVVARALTAELGHRPLFDDAVRDADLALHLAILRARPGLFTGLVSGGLGFALVWAIGSIYLTAGLLGALAGQPFGEAAATRFGAHVRLFAWASPLVVLVLGLLVLGGSIALGGLAQLLDPGAALGRLLLGLTPGALAALALGSALDLARAELALDRDLTARLALARALRRVTRQIVPLSLALLHASSFVGVSLLYLVLTHGRPFAGLAGALLLFALRQAVAATRFLARVATIAAQVAYVAASRGDEMRPPAAAPSPAPAPERLAPVPHRSPSGPGL